MKLWVYSHWYLSGKNWATVKGKYFLFLVKTQSTQGKDPGWDHEHGKYGNRYNTVHRTYIWQGASSGTHDKNDGGVISYTKYGVASYLNLFSIAANLKLEIMSSSAMNRSSTPDSRKLFCDLTLRRCHLLSIRN